MKKLMIGVSLAVLALAGTAVAQQQARHGPDGDGDGTVTRAEMQAHAALMFDRLDASHDGKLDAADKAARRTARFDQVDANHDGQLSRAEFAAARPQRPGGPGGPGAMREGRDGPVARGPMGGAMRRHRGGDRMAMGMGRTADANKDGTITRDEFAAGTLQRFDRGDTNHDGRLTKEERQAAHAAMRGPMRQRMGGGRDGMMGDHDMPPPPPAK